MKLNLKKTKKKPESSSLELPEGLPMNVVIYGKGGVGKTSLAGRFPRPLFIRPKLDRGVEVLVSMKKIPEPVAVKMVTSWDQTLDELRSAIRNKECETVVIDSLTGIERYCFEHVCEQDFRGNWSEEGKGFYSYSAGPKKAAKREWPDLLDIASDLLEAGKHVVLIGHRAKERFVDPKNPDYDTWQPLLDKKIWEITFGWAEIVLYIEDSFDVEKTDGSITKKATESKGRWMYTQGEPSFDAKNQIGLPAMIDMGSNAEESWKNFVQAVRNGE